MLRMLGRLGDSALADGQDAARTLAALKAFLPVLEQVRPRTARATYRKPVVLFGDGACEHGSD